MASLIISDTHFGLDSSTLKNPKKVEQLMQEILEYHGDCDEVILLGDIFDLWRVRPEAAMSDSISFLKTLSGMDIPVRYVVGNHDHHLVVQKQDAELMERAARGDFEPVYIPTLRWHRRFAGIDVDMLYPTYRARCRRKTFLFTHGHHLDGIQTFTLQMVEALRRLSGIEPLPSDEEMMMTYAYESIYRSACIGEVVSFENSLWKASSLILRLNPSLYSHQQRSISVERQYGEIERFIRERELGKIDCFIYGDTHRTGIYQRRGGPLAVNTGCFIRDHDDTSHLETPDTYLLLDDGDLTIRQLGRKTPLYLCELL
ncbi:MAG TPA: metallophosphoesterase family protein [Methanothrix sp.]|nr:metallophosphoesterase family protein [Methanothrix sp.]